MAAQILDGKAVAAQMKDEMRAQVGQLASRGIVPGLGSVSSLRGGSAPVSGRSSSATIRDRSGTSPASTATARRSASSRSVATCPPR